MPLSSIKSASAAFTFGSSSSMVSASTANPSISLLVATHTEASSSQVA